MNIGFLSNVANYIQTDQGIGLQDFLDLEEYNITTIYQAVRKPGGEITSNKRCVTNPGIPVSALAKKKLKLVLFTALHYAHQINRNLIPDLITQICRKLLN